MLLIGALVVIGVAGWAMGRARPKFELVYFVFMIFASVSAHSAIQYAFIDGRLDQAVGDPRGEAPDAILILIAAGEAIGLWLPFLLLPWAQGIVRFWGAVYAIATSVVAAVYYYFPFDPVILDKSLISGFGPPYLLTVIVLIPLLLIGYVLGWMQAMANPRGGDDFDLPIAP
jgi:hypothetical protein